MTSFLKTAPENKASLLYHHMMFAKKMLFAASFLLSSVGCQPAKQFTVYEEYKEAKSFLF